MERTRQIPKTASNGSEEPLTFEVWIGTSHVADLIDRRAGSKSGWELAYTPDWEASSRAFALSPALPLGRRHVGADVSNFFENCLPEREALAELRRTVRLDRTNAVGMAYALRDDLPRAIALRAGRREEDGKDEREEDNEHLFAVERANVFRPITDDELLDRLRGFAPITVWDNRFRLSVAGVQRKLTVMRRDGAWGLADGPDWASTHIVIYPRMNAGAS